MPWQCVKGITLSVMLMAGSLLAASDSSTTVRQEFRQAMNSLSSTPDNDSAALRDYILYPYLQAARLQFALKQPHDAVTLDAQIKAFLVAAQNLPMAREVRRQWLLDLASRQQWTDFLAYLPADNSDIELKCWQATALMVQQSEQQRSSVLEQLLPKLWLSSSRLPTACGGVFEWARKENIINTELIEQRARLILQAGSTEFAKELIAFLTHEQSASLRQWVLLIEKPEQGFDALIEHPEIAIEESVLQDTWLRFTRKDPQAALVRFSRLVKARGWNDATISLYARSLALGLSWSRHHEALQYFAQVLPADRTDQCYEWYARAALWAGDWPLVVEVIDAMPQSLKSQARWRYWWARGQQQVAGIESARATYQKLIDDEDNYFAAMAAARLGTRYVPHAESIKVNEGLVQQLGAQPVMQRIRELLSVDLRNYATSEWNAQVGAWSVGQQEAAVRLIHEWGWYDQAILVAARLGRYSDYQLLYPKPYDDEVNEAVTLTGLTADLIYGQMRQESLFRADAVSAANARGLLQMLPATARATAKQFNRPIPADQELFDPAINVPLAAVHLKSLVDQFDGQILVALAAYNAGSTAVRRWLPVKAMDSDIWMENIPYNETRNYVQRILWHSLVFHWLRTPEPLDTKAWLAPISPLAQ